MRVVQSPVRIMDPELTPRIWVNISGEMHWFESFLEKVYPGGSGILVSNPVKIIAPHGERTFLPHAYYRHFTDSGRPLVPASGRFEMYRPKDHALFLAEFIRRWQNPADERVC